MLKNILLFKFFCLFTLSCLAENVTIVVSIDGFSQQYLTKYQPKNLIELASKGVQSKGLIPVYPTKTFPNHVSIVTGQYPTKHGIFHNRFYREDLDKFYFPGAEINNPHWLLSTPIWTLAEQQHIKTAIYFWPTSEAKINNIQPQYFMPFNDKVPNSERVNQIINWLALPESERPRLILAYLSEVDTAGHLTGVDSKEIKQAVFDVDEQIGRLYQQFQSLNYPINLIVLSDHGMFPLTKNNEIPTNTLISKVENKYKKGITIVNGETQLLIYSKTEQALSDIQKELLTYQHKHPEQYRIFNKNNYPINWHITNPLSPISPDMIVEATPPFVFTYKVNDEMRLHKNEGTHGYEPIHKELAGIFIAIGPDFNSAQKVESFENIHVFPLLKKLLNINSQEITDGNLSVLLPILNK